MANKPNFRPECFDMSRPDICDDPDCRKQIAAFHTVTEERFSLAITGTNALRSYEEAELDALKEIVGKAACTDKVGILHDGTIKVGEDNNICTYSIPLLRAIFDQNPSKIEIYEGNHAINGNDDRLLRVTVNGTIKFYDVSDTYP